MRLSKPQVLLRQIHHWSSILIALPLIIMIGAGLLLMLKKESGWIQPPTQRGASTAMPVQSFETLFAAARSAPEAGILDWADLDRVDIKPSKGVVKFIAHNRWEVQVDTSSAEVLSVSYRRSDLIESIHDGSFFAGWAKLYVFLPAGIVLLCLWITGLYMFSLPHWKRYQRRRNRRLVHPGE